MLLYAFVLFTSLSLISLPSLISLSPYTRPFVCVISAVGREMNGWYLVPFPHCYCRFDSICNKQKKKGQAEALRFFSLGDLSLQSMKHGKQRRERKYRGTDTGREVWYSETKAPIKCRKKIWDRWSQETNRQTDRQRKKKMGSSVTWRKGWAAVGRGTTATGVTHFFLLFTPVAVLAHCVSVFFFHSY